MIFNNKIAAIIMLGGRSRRMGGGIKSLIKFNSESILDKILIRIKPQINKILINCNHKDSNLKKYNLPIIMDLKKGFLGPLAGIHATMYWIIKNEPQVEWIITLPGDTPFIPMNLISKFEKKIYSNSKIILAKSENKIHPIIGAWHKSLFDSLDSHLNKGTRKILSWAELHKLEFINYKCKEYDPFFNINTKEDLKIASKIEKDFFLNKN
ncbi:molybdenum cofactor guanylyltransferase [Alphaproteobacteria bacterium]|nr:molybdenum cofactor guanylyltransferase [Alphaproteobacteria bacterium]